MAICFKTVAEQQDQFDEEARALDEARKEYWAEIRAQIPASDLKALKDAIKIRRKRRSDPDAYDFHDHRVAEILLQIENGTPLATRASREQKSKTATRLSMEAHTELVEQAARDGLISPEAAAESRAMAEAVNRKFGDGKPLEVPHDPETGELTEDIPAFLDRRPKLVAAQ